MKRNNYKPHKRPNTKVENDKFKAEYKEAKEEKIKGKFNDPAWYRKIPGAAMAARKGFTRPTGRPISGSELGLVANTAGSATWYPGIAVLHYVPAVGKTDNDIQSPIDKAANKIWMDFRTKNTGAITYDAVDIILNLVAGVNIHAFYYEMTRLYGLLHNAMITKNEYIPKHLITALGYDYDRLMSNIAEFGIWLNTISNYINSTVHIPKTFSLYDRYVFMNAGVYKDEDLDKFQIYAFKPDGYFIFEERIEGEAGKLIYSPCMTNAGLDDLQIYFNEMWNRYALSESMADIQSGYYKFFGDNAFHELPTMDLNYVVEPIFSADMMRQIQNITFQGPMLEDSEIAQDTTTGFVDATYTIGASNGTLSIEMPDAIMVNLFIDEPSEDDVLEATRCISFTKGVTYEGAGATRQVEKYISTCGSEIFTTMDIVTIYTDDDGRTFKTGVSSGLTTLPVGFLWNGTRGVAINYWATQLDSFSYHPTFYIMAEGASQDTWTYTMCDYANAVVMHEDEIKRLNELVIISQFTIT